MSGKVYIASMNLRGAWANRPDNTMILNVTSAQAKERPERLDFSPMTPIEGGYKGFWNFEHYWQAGKIFEGMDKQQRMEHIKWWKAQTTAKRRCPKYKGHTVVHSVFGGQQFDYVTSRKQVYVPEYFELIQGTWSLEKWRALISSGKDVVVYDFDGPRNHKGEPTCVEVNLDLLQEKIEDTRCPFGHGYVVAASLLGIAPEMFC